MARLNGNAKITKLVRNGAKVEQEVDNNGKPSKDVGVIVMKDGTRYEFDLNNDNAVGEASQKGINQLLDSL